MPIERDLETGDYYETQGFTKTDYILGAFWLVVGIVGLAYAHIAGKARTMKGH